MEKNIEIVLNSRITKYEVSEIKDFLMEKLHAKGNVLLNMENLENIDTAGFQLIVAFVKTVKNEGRKVFAMNISDIVKKSAEKLGLKLELIFDKVE